MAWIANDHYFKAAVPGLISGKLSDVVSLIVFPVFAVSVFELVRERNLGLRSIVAASLATGFVMATINLFPFATWCYEWGLGGLQWLRDLVFSWSVNHRWLPATMTMDATDLLTLPALGVPVYLFWRCRQTISNEVLPNSAIFEVPNLPIEQRV
jgi:hypothetical protein